MKTYIVTEEEIKKLCEKVDDKIYKYLSKSGCPIEASTLSNSIPDTIRNAISKRELSMGNLGKENVETKDDT
jgi:hypothetical protein